MKKLQCLMVGVILGMVFLMGCGKKTEFFYKDHLEDVVVTVDERDIMLSELAFYIAYEEDLVEQQAIIYAPEKPETYWDVHVNGRFLVEVVKEELIKMVVRDEILYVQAMEHGVVLDNNQLEMVENISGDLFGKLSKTQQKSLGVESQNFYEYMLKMAYVEVYVEQLAEKDNALVEEYGVSGNRYQAELTLHNYKVHEEVWEKVRLGNITVER